MKIYTRVPGPMVERILDKGRLKKLISNYFYHSFYRLLMIPSSYVYRLLPPPDEEHVPIAIAVLRQTPTPRHRPSRYRLLDESKPRELTRLAVNRLSDIKNNENFVKATVELNDFIKSVLPPTGIQQMIIEHLFASQTMSDLKIGMGLVREEIKHNPLHGYQLLANYINTHKIALPSLNLTKEEINEIRPYLVHLNFGTFLNGNAFDSWDSQEIHQLIEQCPRLETLQIHLPQIKSLPSCVTQLTSLDCSDCNTLEALPDDMSLLEYLKCTNCHALPTLPKGMVNLKILQCNWSKALKYLPEDMIVLRELNCSGCTIRELPQNMDLLETLHCCRCRNLSHLPSGMKALFTLKCTGCLNLKLLPEDLNPNIIIEHSKCTKFSFQ